MSKRKYSRDFEYEDLVDRRNRKRAMRDDHKDHWKFDPNQLNEDYDYEADGWEGHHSGE